VAFLANTDVTLGSSGSDAFLDQINDYWFLKEDYPQIDFKGF
jgi:hypothetical protein